MKIPLANCSDPAGAVGDLKNEIQILKRLRHEHLCTVYGAGGWKTPELMPFLVLEKLQVENLAQQLGTEYEQDPSIKTQMKQWGSRGKIPFRNRLNFGLQLAKMLRYLHSESIPGGFTVHR